MESGGEKSPLLTALLQLESDVDSLEGSDMTTLESSFKSVMILDSSPNIQKEATPPAPAQSKALDTNERIHNKVCRIKSRIAEFKNRSQA